MITQLHLSNFVRDKVSYLHALARDVASSLTDLGQEEFSDEGPEQLDDRNIAEIIEILGALEANASLWKPECDNWLPHNVYAGILQSSLDVYYRKNESVVGEENIFGETLRSDPLVSENVTKMESRNGRRVGRTQLNKKDPRWALVVYAKLIKRRSGLAKFVDNSANTKLLDNHARMVLVGDWGSGIPRAVKLANNIWSSHLAPELSTRQLHAVHLGDVYYAGLTKEYNQKFLAHWPVPTGKERSVTSWCLPGNHDMYSGGHGFFNMLKDPRFAAQNQSSYFLLENEYWQVFGLDTAFDQRDVSGNVGELYGEQAAWVAQKRATAVQKKCLILSHHQPHSAFEKVEEHLPRRLQPIRSLGRIDAWIWGHEHLCAVYEPYQKVRYPILLGHGGFPERPQPKIPGSPPVNYTWHHTDAKGFLIFGFAVLDFDDDRIQVRFVDEDDNRKHRFTII